ncbi:MAG TPA: 50S ribosomal protein L25 [Acidimicrobiales bacterium]
MAEVTLVAEAGRTIGSAASRRLRAAGRIPAVVYGHGAEGRSVSVDGRELRHALSGQAGLNQLLSLKIGSETHLALARSLQRHPVRHTVLHVDFLIVRRDEVISAEVPLVLTGEAKAVEQERGLVEQQLNSLTVKATPDKIPGHIEVDISALTIGEAIRVGDLKLPAGVTTEVSSEEVIAQGALSRAAAEIEAIEAEAAEAAEAAAEGAPAEGEAAAAGAGAGEGEGAAPGEGASQSEEG